MNEASQTSRTDSATITPEVDKTFYTWSNFFSILTGHASNEERSRYFHTRDILNEDSDCKRCEDNKKYLFEYSPIIRFLKTEIDALGPADGSASITPKSVKCRRCEPNQVQTGGFDSNYGILLCANQFKNWRHQEDTLAHEMIHAYDHMRFKMDPFDLRHAACMEIRASTLSGECRFMKEFFGRGQWKLTQHFQECVRRRAAISVAGRPACGGDDVKAVRVVNEVWESCFNDTRPFDEIYR